MNLSSYTFPSLLSPSTPVADVSHLREREMEIKQVPGGFIVRLTGGGTKWHQRVAVDEEALVAMVREFFAGNPGALIEPKETP